MRLDKLGIAAAFALRGHGAYREQEQLQEAHSHLELRKPTLMKYNSHKGHRAGRLLPVSAERYSPRILEAKTSSLSREQLETRQ